MWSAVGRAIAAALPRISRVVVAARRRPLTALRTIRRVALLLQNEETESEEAREDMADPVLWVEAEDELELEEEGELEGAGLTEAL